MSYKKLLVITLWLITAHSIMVGLGMIMLPTDWIAYFNITPSGHRFFIAQGGVFHIVMAFAYGMAATNVVKNLPLINFAIIAKFCATLFLISYYIFINQYFIVIFSAFGDFCMACLLLILYTRYNKKLIL